LIVWNTDHRHRSSVVLPVEGCEFGYIEGAAVYVGIIGIIEPETNVEAIGRRQTGIRI